MKVVFNKKLESGSYHVQIAISDFSSIEIENMKKFGPPQISISPMSVWVAGAGSVNILPLHGLNYDFKFSNEVSASAFIVNMTDRIKVAGIDLKNKKDDFTGRSELEF